MIQPNRTTLLRRRFPRQGQRGATLVEAAMMLPMFVILWYSSLYVHSLGSKHIDVNTTARQDSWSSAMANCGVAGQSETEQLPANMGGKVGLSAKGGGSSSAVSTALKNGSLIGAFASFVSGFTAIISSIFPNPDGAQFMKMQTISWRVPDLYDHSGMSNSSTPVQGTTTVVCNEAPENGTITKVASGLLGIIEGIVKLF